MTRWSPFEAAHRDAGLKEASVQTYVGRARFFVRWLDGDYAPGGPCHPAARSPALHLTLPWSVYTPHSWLALGARMAD